MVVIEHPGVIEGRQWFFVMRILDPKEAYEDGFIDDDVYASDEEDEGGLG